MILQRITLSDSTINLYLLRTDLIDKVTGGNKYFKLKYNLEEAKRLGHSTLLTFGGAYSNHIAATAASGKSAGLKTIGIIRGDEERELNSTLLSAVENGMQLHFVSREHYRLKEKPEFVNSLKDLFGEFYLLPEGGSNYLAVKGCAEIREKIDLPFDYICCPVGTGGTLAGIIASLEGQEKAIGFSSLMKGESIERKIQQLVQEYHSKEKNQTVNCDQSKYTISYDYPFGGYAKIDKALIKFKNKFEEDFSIELDYIYTAKMLYGISDMIRQKLFKTNSTIVAIHTGGLQGNIGFEKVLLLEN